MRLVALAVLALAVAGPAAAADADREVYFGDAFTLKATDPGPFDRLPDGRLACLTDACANRAVSVGGVTVRVLPRVTAKEVAARRPAYRAPTDVAASVVFVLLWLFLLRAVLLTPDRADPPLRR